MALQKCSHCGKKFDPDELEDIASNFKLRGEVGVGKEEKRRIVECPYCHTKQQVEG